LIETGDQGVKIFGWQHDAFCLRALGLCFRLVPGWLGCGRHRFNLQRVLTIELLSSA
jgi:hypothetical protein